MNLVVLYTLKKRFSTLNAELLFLYILYIVVKLVMLMDLFSVTFSVRHCMYFLVQSPCISSLSDCWMLKVKGNHTGATTDSTILLVRTLSGNFNVALYVMYVCMYVCNVITVGGVHAHTVFSQIHNLCFCFCSCLFLMWPTWCLISCYFERDSSKSLIRWDDLGDLSGKEISSWLVFSTCTFKKRLASF